MRYRRSAAQEVTFEILEHRIDQMHIDKIDVSVVGYGDAESDGFSCSGQAVGICRRVSAILDYSKFQNLSEREKLTDQEPFEEFVTKTVRYR